MMNSTLATHKGSIFTWRKEIPSIQDFLIWKAALMRIKTITCGSSPLGLWICKSHRHKPWQYDKASDVVLFVGTNNVTIFQRVHTRQTREGMIFRYDKQVATHRFPTTPVTITWQGHTPNVIYMQGYSSHLSSYHKSESEAVTPANDIHIEISSTNDREILIRAACKGEIRAVSDASYMSQYSS